MQCMRKKELSTSTPLLNKNIFDTATADTVSEVSLYKQYMLYVLKNKKKTNSDIFFFTD